MKLALALFLVGFVGATLMWLGLVAIPRRLRAVEDLRAFAVARGLRASGDGAELPLRIVGTVRGRLFTVAYQANPVRGSVLLVGVDCDSAAEGPQGRLNAEAGDRALVSRWTEPPAELLGRMETLIDALAEMAEELEKENPAEPDSEH